MSVDLNNLPLCTEGLQHSWIATKWVSSDIPSLAPSMQRGRIINQIIEIGCPTCNTYLNLAISDDPKTQKNKKQED